MVPFEKSILSIELLEDWIKRSIVKFLPNGMAISSGTTPELRIWIELWIYIEICTFYYTFCLLVWSEFDVKALIIRGFSSVQNFRAVCDYFLCIIYLRPIDILPFQYHWIIRDIFQISDNTACQLVFHVELLQRIKLGHRLTIMSSAER
jgi:hypothetical protein